MFPYPISICMVAMSTVAMVKDAMTTVAFAMVAMNTVTNISIQQRAFTYHCWLGINCQK